MPKIAVIGAGPAGIAASIQLSRAGHEVTVFEHGIIGGNLWNAGFVENYPGFPGGITGKHLAQLMEEQFQEYDFVLRRIEVTKAAFTGTHFTVNSAGNEEYDGMILCTGTRPKKAGFPGEDELHGVGLLHYNIMRLEEWYPEGNALVVGGGESSMDMAMTLAERGLKVTLLHRSELRGIKYLLDAVKIDDSITVTEGSVESVRLHGGKAVARIGTEELPFDLILVAVGRESHLPELEGIDPEYPPAGFRIVGDAKHGGLGQAAMAVGDGIRAAMGIGREARK
ncbi:MAG: NAD(P)/FAD-dependent oxidoreductase [Candidatus Thermoplasmatota archaeon]|nr:NAD(P)/FAD-dependent oxidoreductase [Euryarchaeota archaeon]MBU4031964.1 NAD(P)/FAD-dependent oxidoreductase [Candidatus Thermoplasmatota archaeon]MBU4071578.1 NAD(P)/FAD-dependent oxidoreductase [Candidatus Thermoplasmatota archaeon]MBU4143608.1 NAD(P)/FAD-dependent oxidoreductase [Candidatus Thermoplasmatota archaeon]MBU4591339.1 NAD(P)/FAD-dependent oxidoreductase [Candidatus Thermoplasmatota archaeon]